MFITVLGLRNKAVNKPHKCLHSKEFLSPLNMVESETQSHYFILSSYVSQLIFSLSLLSISVI